MTKCAEWKCLRKPIVGLNGKWYCLKHFEECLAESGNVFEKFIKDWKEQKRKEAQDEQVI